MRAQILILIGMLGLGFLNGCSKDFETKNVDRKAANSSLDNQNDSVLNKEIKPSATNQPEAIEAVVENTRPIASPIKVIEPVNNEVIPPIVEPIVGVEPVGGVLLAEPIFFDAPPLLGPVLGRGSGGGGPGILPICGNGILELGEQCDNGKKNSSTRPNACRRTCKLPKCGDNVVDSENGENCDDGNRNGEDGCSSNCRQEATEIAIWPKGCPLEGLPDYNIYSDTTPDARYILNLAGVGTEDDTVIDICTGFMWERVPSDDSNNSNYQEAIELCENSTKAGFDDWRLPTLIELQTLEDFVVPVPDQTWNNNFFIGSADFYLSSTLIAFVPNSVWVIQFSFGDIDAFTVNDNLSVRCVR